MLFIWQVLKSRKYWGQSNNWGRGLRRLTYGNLDAFFFAGNKKWARCQCRDHTIDTGNLHKNCTINRDIWHGWSTPNEDACWGRANSGWRTTKLSSEDTSYLRSATEPPLYLWRSKRPNISCCGGWWRWLESCFSQGQRHGRNLSERYVKIAVLFGLAYSTDTKSDRYLEVCRLKPNERQGKYPWTTG